MVIVVKSTPKERRVAWNDFVHQNGIRTHRKGCVQNPVPQKAALTPQA